MANGTNSGNQGLPPIPIDEFSPTSRTLYKLCVGGTLVSIIFLSLKFLSNFAVPNDLRRLSDKLVNHLSWTLLMSQIIILITVVIRVTTRPTLEQEKTLIGLSVVLHFSVLSVFFFLNALVFNLFRSSSSTPQEGQSSQMKYCLYAYGIPACIVLAALILQWILPASSTFRSNYTAPLLSWPRNFDGLTVFLLVPLGILLAANILLLLLTALKSTFRPYCSHRYLQHPIVYDEYMHQRGEDGCCCRFIQYFLLNALVVVTWIFRLLPICKYRFLMFFMLSILQGPFVFFAFTPLKKLSCKGCRPTDERGFVRSDPQDHHGLINTARMDCAENYRIRIPPMEMKP